MSEPSLPEEVLFAQALEVRAAAERSAFLERACGNNPALRAEVEALLRAHERSGDLLDLPERPAATVDQPLLPERPGTMIGPYKLLEPIGEGGFGVVFRAEQTQPLRRQVALKVLKPGMDTRQVIARFEAERQALAIMDHPHIAKVLDAGESASGRPYFVMDLVKGVPITDYCDQNQLTPRQRLELFASVCQAVQHAHQKGIIHRDLKPSNVLVSRHDATPVVKVIDFGIAKAMGQQLTDKTLFTNFAQMIGTPLYMSPEQAGLSDLDVDTRSDIYSLGVLLYELLTGTTPFDKERFQQVAYDEMRRIIREEEPPKPSTRISTLGQAATTVSVQRQSDPRKLSQLFRGELDWMVMKCLEKDRNRRYESASALARDIERYLSGEPVLAHPPSAAYRLRKFVRRHKGPVLAAAVLLVVLVAGAVGTALGLIRAARAQAAEVEQRVLAERHDAKAKEAALAEAAERRQFQAVTGLLEEMFYGMHPREAGDLKAQLGARLKAVTANLEKDYAGDPLAGTRLRAASATALLGLGDLAQAIALFEQVLDERRQQLGPAARLTLEAEHNLAEAYREGGRVRKALSLLEELLPKQQQVFGADHSTTLVVMSNLAFAYGDTGHMDKAAALFEQILETYKTKLGPAAEETLRTMNNLAQAYTRLGEGTKAVTLLEEVLAARRAALPRGHPETLRAMSDVADALATAGDFAKAFPLFDQALEGRKAKLGLDHPDTLMTLTNMGHAFVEAGQPEKAIPLLEQAVERARVKLGANHSLTVSAIYNLGRAYVKAGRHAQAVPILERSVERSRAVFGPEHPSTIFSLSVLGVAYSETGQPEKALPCLQEGQRLAQARFGRGHPETANAAINLGTAYLKLRQPDKAEPLFKELLDSQRAQLGPGHPLLMETGFRIAAAYHAAGKTDAAESVVRATLVPGYEALRTRGIKLSADDRMKSIQALDRLVELYEDSGKKEQAAAWRAKLEALNKN